MELLALPVIIGSIAFFALLGGVFTRLGEISHLLATQNWLLTQSATAEVKLAIGASK